MLINRAS